MRAYLTIAFSLAALAVAACRCQQAAAATNNQPSTEVSLHERDLIEESLAHYLVLPGTALWRFSGKKPYLGSTQLVCGSVNYQSSVRKYVGYHRFYALLDDGRVTLSQIEDRFEDPSGRLGDKLDFLCGKA